MIKITPTIPKVSGSRLQINDIVNGEFFLYDGELYQAVGGDGYCITDTDNNPVSCGEEEFEVIPVDVEIKWSKKGKK